MTWSDGDLLTPSNLENKSNAPVFNVKDFGAVGDGSTDDTTAFTSAKGAAVSNGGEVYVPPGTYLLGNVTTFDSGLYPGVLELDGDDDITFRFAAGASVVGDNTKGTNDAGYAIFVVKGSANFRLFGGVFDGGDARANKGIGSVVAFRPGTTATTQVRIENVVGKNLRHNGINTQNVTSSNVPIIDGIVVSGCRFEKCEGHGLTLGGADNVHVVGNHCENCFTEGFGAYGIDASDGGDNVTIVGNTIVNCDFGIKADSDADSGLQSLNASIVGNILEAGANTTGRAIRLAAERFVCEGNVVTGAFNRGFRINDVDLQTAVINNNIFDGPDEVGDVIHTGSTSDTFVEKDRLVIQGNVFANASTAGLTIRSSGVVVENNLFYEIEDRWIQVRNDNNSETGATYDNIEISGNRVFNCAGLWVAPKTGEQAQRYSFVDNHIVSDIGPEPVIDQVDNLVFNSNQVSQTTTGSRGQFFDSCANAVIQGNRVETQDEECIHLQACDQYTVVGNVVGKGSHGIRTSNTTNKGLVGSNLDTGSDTSFDLDGNTTSHNNI